MTYPLVQYPYVPAHHDYGAAKGPRLGLVIHMAEGAGTVGYLSRPNPNGVSVHFVVEHSGRIVQMLPLDHANGSIRPTAIRTDDDPPYTWAGVPIVYGRTAAQAVLGTWADDPNSATIGVEIEGYAADGPNADQTASLVRLYADLANRFPGIRSLGHRDFAGYKRCPGHKLPWDRVGGHGPIPEVSPMSIYQRSDAAGYYIIPAGKDVRAWKPAPDGWAVARTWEAAPSDSSARYDAHLVRLSGDTQPRSLLHVLNGALAGLYVSTADVEERPDAPTDDCAAAIAADRAKAHVSWE